VTLDDVEDSLWRSGIRSAATVDSILRLVRLYRMAAARVPEAPPERCARCLRVTDGACKNCAADAIFTCRSCGIPKSAGEFYRRHDLSAGYYRKCKNCHDRKDACRTCGTRWQAEHLQEGQCPPCRTGPPAPTGRYLCRKCGGRKAIAEFPPVKQEDPSRQSWCSDCRDRYGRERVPTRTCPACRKRKPVTSYPEPGACLACREAKP
jgi:hypothetical protein